MSHNQMSCPKILGETWPKPQPRAGSKLHRDILDAPIPGTLSQVRPNREGWEQPKGHRTAMLSIQHHKSAVGLLGFVSFIPVAAKQKNSGAGISKPNSINFKGLGQVELVPKGTFFTVSQDNTSISLAKGHAE